MGIVSRSEAGKFMFAPHSVSRTKFFLVLEVGFTFVAPFSNKLFENKSNCGIKDLENNQEAG